MPYKMAQSRSSVVRRDSRHQDRRQATVASDRNKGGTVPCFFPPQGKGEEDPRRIVRPGYKIFTYLLPDTSSVGPVREYPIGISDGGGRDQKIFGVTCLVSRPVVAATQEDAGDGRRWQALASHGKRPQAVARRSSRKRSIAL